MPQTQSAKLKQPYTQKLHSGTIMLSNTTDIMSFKPTLKSTNESTPDSSKNSSKLNNKNENKTPM
eukprot:11880825-Ditylum_brightwellii.AAC.1